MPQPVTSVTGFAIVMSRHITMNERNLSAPIAGHGSLSEGAGAKRLKESAVDNQQLSMKAAAMDYPDSLRHRLAAMPPPSAREAGFFHDNDKKRAASLFRKQPVRLDDYSSFFSILLPQQQASSSLSSSSQQHSSSSSNSNSRVSPQLGHLMES